MPKIILCNRIESDGIGDFSHFIDTYHALKKDPKTRGIEYILVIECRNFGFLEKLKSVLKSLDSVSFLIDQNEDELDENLIKHFSEAEKTIVISAFPGGNFLQYCKPPTQLYFIGEHEQTLVPEDAEAQTKRRCLGLRDECYGIKLTNAERITTEEALLLLKEDSSPFFTKLLSSCKVSTVQEFNRTHVLIPAYFNFEGPFVMFLSFLVQNEKALDNKDIAIFLSGITEEESYLPDYLNRLRSNSDLNRVELIMPNRETASYPISEKGTKVIRIFSGFKVSDKPYNALYQQAIIAGISGDNTFERTISCKTLPYYVSTNSSTKRATLRALCEIVKNLTLPMAEKTRNDFINYFNYLGKLNQGSNENIEQREIIQALDMPAMLAAWPKIAKYLIAHYNFYDQLSDIVFDAPSLKTCKEIRASKLTSISQLSMLAPKAQRLSGQEHLNKLKATLSSLLTPSQCNEVTHKDDSTAKGSIKPRVYLLLEDLSLEKKRAIRHQFTILFRNSKLENHEKPVAELNSRGELYINGATIKELQQLTEVPTSSSTLPSQSKSS